MDRKWRTNRDAIKTVMAYQEFCAQIPEHDNCCMLAGETDLYALYTVLHIECKESQLCWSPEGHFHYFIAVQQVQDSEGGRPPSAPDGEEDTPQGVMPPQASGHPAALSTAEQVQVRQSAQPGCRTQIIIPVSSSCSQLSPQLMHRLFRIRGVQAQQLVLALVDGNGVVSRTCLYNYIQAPLEGPGSANLELLDD